MLWVSTIFALRKRLRYATVLVDMDTRRPVDVLTDRRVDATATWLRAHPETRIVCRDGSPAYAEAINQGAPQAVQISDRWHLWKGLGDAALEEVATHSGLLVQSQPADTGRQARGDHPRTLAARPRPTRSRCGARRMRTPVESVTEHRQTICAH
ncbi:transposase [Actinophytocola sp.]|uniref:transposase n=1 Tax=Actinophytocola sp. TaxID=1872138 RepID=UPI003D6A35E3